MREPNLQYFSDTERDAVVQQVMLLFDEGKDDEADALYRTLPMPAEYLQTLKEHMGVNALIEEGINLSTAVEKYGKKWLVS